MKKLILIGMFSIVALASADRASTFCRVYKTNEHRTFSNRCYGSDEVMTGTVSGDPSSIYCARLVVDCNRRDVAKFEFENEHLDSQLDK